MLTLSLSAVPILRADDEWPQFRGPDGQGHADGAHLPLNWSETDGVAWRTALPGEGHSSPVVSGNQVWLTAAVTSELSDEERERRLSQVQNPQSLQLAGSLTLKALCINRESGAIEREVTLFDIPDAQPKHALNSYASPTPVLASGRIYCHFGSYGTASVDCRTGEVMWRNTSIQIDHQNGPGSSPVLWENRLIIHFDGTDSQSIVAFNADNGEVLWRTQRSGDMDPTPDLQKAYGTPLIVEADQRPLVISPAANWVYAYDPRDGREIWKASYGQLGFSTVPRPVVSGDTVFIATSYMQSRLLAVNMTGEGDVTASHVAWSFDKQVPQKPSMIIAGERLFFVSDKGIIRCLQLETGDELWFERLPGDYSASPIASGDTLYFFNQDGVCSVVQASSEFKLLAENRLDSGIMASPAVAGDSLFIRTATSLYRIDGR